MGVSILINHQFDQVNPVMKIGLRKYLFTIGGGCRRQPRAATYRYAQNTGGGILR